MNFLVFQSQEKSALTLVIDEENGTECYVQHALSKRKYLEDVVCDLKSREGTGWRSIGYWSTNGNYSDHESVNCIGNWATKRGIEAVVWTALESNFQEHTNKTFTVENAIQHLRGLSPMGQLEAKEYIWRAPEEVRTKLRAKLEAECWF